MRKIKNQKGKLNLDTYREIKNLSREQMEYFLNYMYSEGVKSGKKQAATEKDGE